MFLSMTPCSKKHHHKEDPVLDQESQNHDLHGQLICFGTLREFPHLNEAALPQ